MQRRWAPASAAAQRGVHCGADNNQSSASVHQLTPNSMSVENSRAPSNSSSAAMAAAATISM